MTEQTWISIFGEVNISSDGVITCEPRPVTAVEDGVPPADGVPPHPVYTLIRSNLQFDEGKIEWEVKLADPNTSVQLWLPAEPVASSTPAPSKKDSSSSELAVGLNLLGAPYGFANWNGTSWEGLGGAGQRSRLPSNEWISLKLNVRGSNADFFIEGVKVLSTVRTLKRGQIGFLLRGDSSCSVRNVVVTQNSPKCFCIMQFTDEFDVLYRDVIYPVCASYGYDVVRGDDFYTSGQIMEDITQSIQEAALIIADVTPDNANVFYEVGYAHAIGKHTILLSDKKRERLPFDISGFRTLFYDNTIGGKAIVETRLKQHLDALRPK